MNGQVTKLAVARVQELTTMLEVIREMDEGADRNLLEDECLELLVDAKDNLKKCLLKGGRHCLRGGGI